MHFYDRLRQEVESAAACHCNIVDLFSSFLFVTTTDWQWPLPLWSGMCLYWSQSRRYTSEVGECDPMLYCFEAEESDRGDINCRRKCSTCHRTYPQAEKSSQASVHRTGDEDSHRNRCVFVVSLSSSQLPVFIPLSLPSLKSAISFARYYHAPPSILPQIIW